MSRLVRKQSVIILLCLLEQNKKAELLALIAEDAALAENTANIDEVEKFLYVYRDFYRLLKNFVTLHDFYDKDKKVKAIFQARIDAQVDGGAWYPETIEGWKNNSRIVVNGNCVMMIAYSECDAVVEAFNGLF